MIYYLFNPGRYLPESIKKSSAIGKENRKAPRSSRRKSQQAHNFAPAEKQGQ
jgi:hypothetical protein